MRLIKENKLFYYIKNFTAYYLPQFVFNPKDKKKIDDENNEEFVNRVNYYNKISEPFFLNEDGIRIKDFKLPKKMKTYFFDTYVHLKYYNSNLKFIPLFGDIVYVPKEPSFVKSRPIKGDNKNSILLKLNKSRHYRFVEDSLLFESKKDILIGRSKVLDSKPHRGMFLNMYFDHSMCDIGKINKTGINDEWFKPKISIEDHLKYKFILCLEGNDVATNLKWVMSSNSLAVMPMPKYETWFMEGRLIPDYHFVCIKEDYSDLETKLMYYINNPDKSIEIIKNANKHVNLFKNRAKEKEISFGVLNKYFEYTR